MSTRTADDGVLPGILFFLAVAVLSGAIALQLLGPTSPVAMDGPAALWAVLLGVLMPGLAVLGVAVWAGLTLNGSRR